ncbi:hypothetical protein ACA910_001258 [Epithemia clementina (nom. ined.)]
MSEVYLGGEPSFLDPHVEKEGVAEILAVLTSEEKARMPDPAMPIRHLRAEKGDVAKAAEKLKDALEWRKTFDADALVKATTPDGSKEYKQLLERENVTGKIYIRGYDKDGRALMYMRPGRENTNALEDQMKHLVWNLEKAIACTNRKSRELGAKEPLEKVNLVIDYEGFTLGNAPSLTASRYTLDILQKHFPERMHRAYVLNPPFVFQAFWTIVKPFVDPISKEKIVFCSGEDGVRLLHDNMDQIDKLEPVAKGSATKAFDSKAYLKLPFHVSFDEDVEADDNENDDPANDEGR